jgi:hypothetical protein
MRTKRTISILTVAAILAAIPLTAFAGEDEVTRADNVDQPARKTATSLDGVAVVSPDVDRPAHRPSTDSPRSEPDRCETRLEDNPRRCIQGDDTETRPIHRCLRFADNPRRCLHIDDSHPVNVRHLIWRLIKAHEWGLLHRLLHWLVA